jgi:hypothetical protein
MNKQDMLFIRACKSSHPTRRIKRLYKMFYLCPSDTIQTIDLVQILAGVCDRNLPKITFAKAVDMSNPFKWQYTFEKETRNHFELWFDALVSELRYTDTRTIDGYIMPCWWRNRK